VHIYKINYMSYSWSIS